jgi:transposase
MNHHRSRLVTLGEILAALVETGGLAAMTLGSLGGAVTRAPFRQPHTGCGCGCGPVRRRYHGRHEPPIHRCGGC